MIYAGIVAGGTGSRMGADKPKQFLEIGGCPIIVRTVRRFLAVAEIELIYIAVNSEWLGYTERLLSEQLDSDEIRRIRLIKGGSDRNGSVFNIINRIEAENGITDDDILLTHDAVRPFVSEDIIRANIKCLSSCKVCTTAVPATDTLLYSEDNIAVTGTPDRSKMYHAQTPQSFSIKAILEAYDKLGDADRSRLTDVCGIFTAAGEKVHIVTGDVSNIKITTPFDLKISEAILK